MPVLIECKSAGDFTNTNKRRKEETTKIEQLRNNYGKKVEFILFLCGYFDSGYLDDLSNPTFAVRTELREDSGWYMVNLSKANSTKLRTVVPKWSGGEAGSFIKSALNEVTFSAPAGFYENGFSLSLGAAEGYTIYYTLDGSDPVDQDGRFAAAGAGEQQQRALRGQHSLPLHIVQMGKLPADQLPPDRREAVGIGLCHRCNLSLYGDGIRQSRDCRGRQ